MREGSSFKALINLKGFGNNGAIAGGKVADYELCCVMIRRDVVI